MFLFEEISLAKKYNSYAPLPLYIQQNLNPNFMIREYQKEAFCNFITYFENEDLRKYPSQLLFHMATGSGKTLIMGGLLLYLYKKGYRNFLFFVNSSNIIKKTKENFLNQSSTKYLFNNYICIDGEYVKIQEVTNFQGVNLNDINICFTTIQALHMDLWNAKENSLSLDDFINSKTVFLSDEAHHINVETKKGKLSASEENNNKNWEYSVNSILGSNKHNILLEFTATCDLENKDILAKYRDRIICDYPLKKFRIDGFSKEIETIQTDIPLMERALQACLLSQYRMKLFQEKGLNIKPVILFKAAKIEDSKVFMANFIEMIKNLTTKQLEELREKVSHPIVKKMFTYFISKDLSLAMLAQEIKESFNENTCISVNDDKEADEKQIIINSLEDDDNPYRAVFEVKKLDEGWDVLNLFDIVRLYETRDGNNGKPGKKTIQEAQLIGRGARYCPFRLNDEQDKYTRKFDDLDDPMKICEELYYHCQHDSSYVSELKIALREYGLLPDKIVEQQYILKDEFKQSDFYQKGIVFLNSRKLKDRNNILGLPESILAKIYSYDDYSGKSTSDKVLSDTEPTESTSDRTYKSFSYSISEIAETNYSLIHRVLRRFEVFKFNTLKSKFPNLTSTKEFVTSTSYLGGVKIKIQTTQESITPNILYSACIKTLHNIGDSLESIEQVYEGTKEFRSKLVHDIFKDKRINIYDPKDQGHGISQNAPTVSSALKLDLSKEDWYVFNDNFGTSEEKAFVKYFSYNINALKQEYDTIYLVRNERQLAIYSFNHGERFEPDYLLFLFKNNHKGVLQYQIFIEPKGEHLFEKDSWKKHLLLSLQEEAIPTKEFVDDNEYHIWGWPFYNHKFEEEVALSMENLFNTNDESH